MQTITVIGGGASGMAAALAARERLDNRVLLIERQARLGRKLLATGNGRCNLTNLHAAQDRYHGEDPGFVRPALDRFPPEETLRWFASLGLVTHVESGGRVYPVSNAAGSVVDCLRLALEARGVRVVSGSVCAGAARRGRGFLLSTDGGDEISCHRLIIACGGMAGAKLGGVRDGYDLLSAFGHHRTALLPSLVQLRTENTWTRAMKGVRVQAEITLERGGEVLARETGEVQFAEYGVTGPAVFDISRAAACAGAGCDLVLRLLPELDSTCLRAYLRRKRDSFPNYRAEHLLTGCCHGAVARTLLRRAALSADSFLWGLTDEDLDRVAAAATRFTLPLQGPMGFSAAQVTAGGMRTDEFDPSTLESRLVPGLHACGEVLDVDGDCGGFNLQWAWSSGRLAGLSAADAG